MFIQKIVKKPLIGLFSCQIVIFELLNVFCRKFFLNRYRTEKEFATGLGVTFVGVTSPLLIFRKNSSARIRLAFTAPHSPISPIQYRLTS